MNNESKKIRPHFNVFYMIVCYIALVLALLIMYALQWSLNEYGQVPFAQVVFHLKVPMAGTSTTLVEDFIKGFLPIVIPALVALTAILVLSPILHGLRMRKSNHGSKGYRIYRISFIAAVGGFLLFALIRAWVMLGISEYIDERTHPTTIYEDYYVDASKATITFPEQKKNVIYIFLESMENSYASEEYGGVMPKNLIPELTELALEHESFGDGKTLAGGVATTGATWTVGAMVAQTAGIPLSLPVNVNSYGAYSSFLPGATSLGDILRKEGYAQEIMMGSNAAFGGRLNYFTQHGNYKIFDLKYALNLHYIDKSNDFWGYDDARLYEFAKEEILELAAADKPFNFSLLTVDTHFPTGWTCEFCPKEYDTSMENAIACSSKLTMQFIDWITKQDFYKDTVIVVAGDHPNMGKIIENKIPEGYQRLTYFTILNSDTERKGTQTREYATMDLFPTTLAAMGATIEGDRLGLGTNLYSDKKTLVEELGVDGLNAELGKASSYYETNILGQK